MDKREELEKELKRILFSNDYSKEDRLKFLYNFIISERKRIVHCLTGIDEDNISKGQLLVLRRHILRSAGIE